jgi:hypothetical protein
MAIAIANTHFALISPLPQVLYTRTGGESGEIVDIWGHLSPNIDNCAFASRPWEAGSVGGTNHR